MDLKIKLVDDTMPMPAYQTDGAVAFDLYARKDMEVAPFTPTIIPLNVIVKVPEGYVFMLCSRSSLPLKKHLMVANSVGIIDQDYCGENDEVGLQVLNFTKEPIKVEKGERLAQGLFVKIEKVANFVKVSSMSAKSRGGFGSTGGHSKHS